MEDIEPMPEWDRLIERCPSKTIMIVGASDSGKSTLVRWLAARLCEKGRTVGWIDGDPGQSTLGLPATMTLAVVDGITGRWPEPTASFFVGSTSPAGHMLPILVGLHRLRERARREGADTILVDTTGLVEQSAGGGALKEWKLALLRPELVVALQKEGELEHILAPLRKDPGTDLLILPPSPLVRGRGREVRGSRRRQKLLHYFQSARPVDLSLAGIPMRGAERIAVGRLLALEDREGFVLSLGLVSAADCSNLKVLTPLVEKEKIAGIRFGSLIFDPVTGEEGH